MQLLNLLSNMLSSAYVQAALLLAWSHPAGATVPVNIQNKLFTDRQRILTNSTEPQTTDTNTSTFTPERCVAGFLGLDFNFRNFDRYDEYFRDDSILTLAQAGEYKGAEDIEEYVMFATESSPYFMDAKQSLLSTLPELRSLDENGICEFAFVSGTDYTMNPETTEYASEFTIAMLTRVSYDSVNNYIPNINVFYNVGFLSFFFEKILTSKQTRKYLCERVLNGSCNFSINDCEEELNELDTFTDGAYIDGNSYGCRALHGVFAETNPTNHCPHVSLDPMTDPNGNMKCYESYLIQPEKLFEEADFVMFENFETELGVDPKVGYLETCDRTCAEAKMEKSGGESRTHSRNYLSYILSLICLFVGLI